MSKLIPMTMGLLLALGMVAVLVPALPGAAAPAAAAEEELSGKQVFLAEKCNLCHAVSSADIEAKTKSEKMKGPDLTGEAAEREPEWLAGYLTRKEKLEGKEHKKEFKGSDEELAALIDWLLEQKAQD